MKIKTLVLITAALMTSLSLHVASAATAPTTIKITHTPIKWGVKGQPLTLKARVTGGIGGIKQVTLYYALFRDAAPFRVDMASSGIGFYMGTIEAGLLSGVDTLSYYIEAEDKDGTLEETPWYDITFKTSDPLLKSGSTVNPTGSSDASSDKSSSATIGLIAGGAAAIAVGAYVISDSGGGGGGSSNNSSDPQEIAGTYGGNATTCTTVPPADTICSFSAITILIDPNGKVYSDTLVPGQELVGDLDGDSFTLIADTSDTNQGITGSIIFSGNVVGNSTIVGSINGSISDVGVPGFYSGNFNATKQ